MHSSSRIMHVFRFFAARSSSSAFFCSFILYSAHLFSEKKKPGKMRIGSRPLKGGHLYLVFWPAILCLFLPVHIFPAVMIFPTVFRKRTMSIGLVKISITSFFNLSCIPSLLGIEEVTIMA